MLKKKNEKPFGKLSKHISPKKKILIDEHIISDKKKIEN